MSGESLPSSRDWDLVEVALDSAAQACQSGAMLSNKRDLDPLAREYLQAARAMERLRRTLEKDS